MRSLSLVSASVLGVSALLASAGSAQATILTFNMGQGNNAPILQSYGDRVGGQFGQPPGFSYGDGGEGPTPNITVDYFGGMRISDDPLFKYGDLEKVIFRSNDNTGGIMEFQFVADPGFLVQLYSFDMAVRINFGANPPLEEDLPVKAIRVLDGPGTTLFYQKLHATDAGTPVTNPGTLIPGHLPLVHNHYDFAAANGGQPFTAPILRIQIDLNQVFGKIEHFGVDNIRFGQTGVPTPGAGLVFAGGMIIAARRRR
jgi:hypothetical protein